MNDKHLKFVVLKGVEGFGDRLQYLLQAILYAKNTKRILIVDWTDESWTHDIKINADFYFKFKNLLFFPYEAFVEYFLFNYTKISVYPKIWKKNLIDNDYINFIYKDIFQIPNNSNRIFWEIANWNHPDFKEDVVVMPGTNLRTWKYETFSEIVFNKWITDKMSAFADKNNLISKNYDVIHLRGGSKKWTGGSTGNNKKYATEINNKFKDIKDYLKLVYRDFEEKKQSLEKKNNIASKKLPIYLVSDSKLMINEWKKIYKIGLNLSEKLFDNFEGKSGSHKLNQDELYKEKISKIDVNYYAILDFHILLNARIIGCDKVSTFSNMANEIGKLESSFFKFVAS